MDPVLHVDKTPMSDYVEWWCRQGKPKIRYGSNRKCPKCVKLPKLRFVCFVPCLPTKREEGTCWGWLVVWVGQERAQDVDVSGEEGCEVQFWQGWMM